MKVSFFAAALIGVIGLQSTQAVNLPINDIDFADYEPSFTQIESLL